MDELFDQNAYLSRIGVNAPITNDLPSLQMLHQAQVFTLPFENLDIHLGRGVDVAPAAIFDKLVHHRRGGYCFELNGLFLQALQSFGFEARALLGRVHVSGQPSGRTHQLSLVTIGGEDWIADVGFGVNCPHQPMPLARGHETEQHGSRYRLVDAPPWGTMLQSYRAGSPDRGPGWMDLYSFDQTVVCQADIETGNHYTATSPESFFTKLRLAILPNPGGRATLTDFALTIVADGVTEQAQVEPGAPYLRMLDERFGIDLATSYENLRPLTAAPKPPQ